MQQLRQLRQQQWQPSLSRGSEMPVDEEGWMVGLVVHVVESEGVPISEATKRASELLETAGVPWKKPWSS